jgi:crotonobetaine/carnitine-CoA ligase
MIGWSGGGPAAGGIGEGLTAPELLEAAVGLGDPNRPFVYSEGRTYSYRDIHEESLRVATALAGLGVGRGDRVITMLANTPRAISAIFGIAAAGGSYVPIIPESSGHEVEYLLDDCPHKALLVDGRYLPALARLLRGTERTPPVLVSGDPADVTSGEGLDVTRFDETAPIDRAALDRPRLEDEFCIMYTSGTTSRPKGAILGHEGFGVCAAVHSRRFHTGPSDTYLGVMPLFHAGGLYQCVAPALASGGGLMLQERFSVSSFWSDVDFSGATVGIMMPAMMAMIVARSTGPRENSLRNVLTFFVNPQFEEWFDVQSMLLWGMSELSAMGVNTEAGYDGYRTPQLAGFPVDDRVEVKVVDEEGDRVPVEATGEIVCRHPWVFRGYLNRPRDTAATLRDGWVFSGDLGCLDDRGRLYFRGRRKNMIKRSGENISGVEVEETIRSFPGVQTCVCFGVTDPIRTEEIKVVILPEPGAAVAPEEIVDWCASRLADFKVPRYIAIHDQLPYTLTGKVDLAALIARHEANYGWDREREPLRPTDAS